MPSGELLAEVFDSAPLGIVEALIDAGAPCDAILSAHFRDLEFACRKGRIEGKIKLLLARADLNKVMPPPAWQCVFDPATMEAVLAHGADPNPPPASSFHEGSTPLLCALSLTGERSARVAHLLIAAGADVTAALTASHSGKLLGANALHLACHQKQSPALIRRIIDTGRIDVNALAFGETALTMAAKYLKKPDGIATVSMLLEAGADPDIGKPTPLDAAFASCNFDVALILLKHGATPKANLDATARLRGTSRNSLFPMFCLLRAFGGDVPLEKLGAVYDAQLHGSGKAWSEASAEHIVRTALPRLLTRIP